MTAQPRRIQTATAASAEIFTYHTFLASTQHPQHSFGHSEPSYGSHWKLWAALCRPPYLQWQQFSASQGSARRQVVAKTTRTTAGTPWRQQEHMNGTSQAEEDGYATEIKHRDMGPVTASDLEPTPSHLLGFHGRNSLQTVSRGPLAPIWTLQSDVLRATLSSSALSVFSEGCGADRASDPQIDRRNSEVDDAPSTPTILSGVDRVAERTGLSTHLHRSSV